MVRWLALLTVVDIVIFVDGLAAVFWILIDIFLAVIVFRAFEAAFLLVVALSPKSCLGLPHLIELLGSGVSIIVLEDLILLVLHVLHLQLLDDLLLVGTSLVVLDVVEVQLVLEVVDVCVLLNISSIVSLEFGLQAFILLLELWLDILNTLESLVSALQFHSASLNRVLKNALVSS